MPDPISHLVEKIRSSLLDETQELTFTISERNEDPREVVVKTANPFEIDWGRFLPQYMDLPVFFTAAADLIEDAQVRAGIADDKRIVLVEDFSPERFGDLGNGKEVISYKINKRVPGQMNANASGRPQRGHLHHYSLRSPNHPNKIIEVESRPVDHEVQFTVWAKTNSLANNRALWLENLFIDHSWAFTAQGAERFLWTGRGPDTFWSPSGQRLSARPLKFFLRTREFRVKAHSIIRQILVETSRG